MYNDYADEDIPDSIGNLPDADIIRARSRSARGSAEHSATQSIACACCAASCLDEAHRRRPLTLLRRYLPRNPLPRRRRRRRRRRRTRTPTFTLSPARRRRTRSAVRSSFKITAPAARGGPREPSTTSLGRRSPKRRSPKRPRPERPAAPAGVPVH